MRMHLNLFILLPGHHDSAWRHPLCESERLTDVTYYQELARIAEHGRLDSIFLADALWHLPRSNYCGGLEPLTLLAAIAVVTDRVGLISTASTSYYEPFHLARKFASIDHISGGRAGWNIVVSNSVNEARNFSLQDMLPHDSRYDRADEFVAVAEKLWDSWDADAVIRDDASGHYSDPGRVHVINHVGRYFKVRGPLNIQRSPQGRPLLVQAGASTAGKAFAARHADAIFTVQRHLPVAAEFRTEMQQRAAAHGRTLKVLPGLIPIIGSTQAEADNLREQLISLQVMDYGVEHLSRMLNADLTDCPIDGPLPWSRLREVREVNGNQTTFKLITELGLKENATIREIVAQQGFGRGHLVVTGTPEKIASTIAEWVEAGAADGFNVMPPIFPTGLQDFVTHVIPLLQRRKLFRTEYEGCTLRSHYGATEALRGTAHH